MGSNSWKTRTLLIGAVVGGIAGVMAAMMFIRSGEEAASTSRRGRPRVQPKHMLQVGVGLIGLLQKIAGLADD